MEVTLGKEGLGKTHQTPFPEEIVCVYCKGTARIGFVAHEGLAHTGGPGRPPCVCDLHSNKGKGGYWPHDYCAVAVYLCKQCFKPTALFNQG